MKGNANRYVRIILVSLLFFPVYGFDAGFTGVRGQFNIDPVHPNAEVAKYALAQIAASAFVVLSSVLYLKMNLKKIGGLLWLSFFCYVTYIWSAYLWFSEG